MLQSKRKFTLASISLSSPLLVGWYQLVRVCPMMSNFLIYSSAHINLLLKR